MDDREILHKLCEKVQSTWGAEWWKLRRQLYGTDALGWSDWIVVGLALALQKQGEKRP